MYIDYATTLFRFTWPVDKAQKVHMLADQGFDFANYFDVHGVHLHTPSHIRGKQQLSLEEVVLSNSPFTLEHGMVPEPFLFQCKRTHNRSQPIRSIWIGTT